MCFFYRQHLRALSRYQALRLGLLLQDCTRALYQTTRRRPGGEKQSPTSPMPTAAASPRTLHKVTRSSYSVERAMEVLLKDGTGARMLSNCTATFFLFDYKTVRGPHTTRLQGGGGGRGQPTRWRLLVLLFFQSENRSFKYYYYYNTLITLLRSLRLRPLLLQTPQHDLHFVTARREIFTPKGEIFLSALLATLLNFKTPAGGDEVTWPGNWRGNFYSWRNLYLPCVKATHILLTTKASTNN